MNKLELIEALKNQENLTKAEAAKVVEIFFGEMTAALEKVFTRYRAEIHVVSGIYGAALEGEERFTALRKRVAAFAVERGRRPRLLVVKLGQDGHDRGAKIVATAFADLGFDVDIGPLFQEPEEAARQAVENDVHVIGISTMAAAHGTLVPRVFDALRKEGARDIVVICGGVIPPRDRPALREQGVAAFFGPGTSVTAAAGEVLRLIGEHRPDGEGKGG